MKFARRERNDSPEINITSLIDVVFLLLIFFMVSTTFSRHAQIKIDLPESSAEKQEQKDRSVEIAIDAQGRYYMEGRQLVNTQLRTLMQALRKATEGMHAPPIVISADGKTPHQAVITAMDAARQLGLLHLTFATAKSSDDGP